MELRKVPIHRSLLRPHLLLGVDRDAFFTSAFVCGGVFWVEAKCHSTLGMCMAVAAYAFAMGLLRKLAVSDPLAIAVYMDNRKLKDFYGANSDQ